MYPVHLIPDSIIWYSHQVKKENYSAGYLVCILIFFQQHTRNITVDWKFLFEKVLTLETNDIPSFFMTWFPNKYFRYRFAISPHHAYKVRVYAIKFFTGSFRMDDERTQSLLRGVDHYFINPVQESKSAGLN